MNYRQLNKERLIAILEREEWMKTHRCRHGHTYAEHPQCLYDEHPEMALNLNNPEEVFGEKICFLDIEASNLKADFGVPLSWHMTDMKDDSVVHDFITIEDMEEVKKTGEFDRPDKRMLKNFVDKVIQYNRVVTHYGTYFDLPFLRSRCIYDDIPFPEYGTLYQDDVWKWARHKLCISSNRQKNISKFFYGESEKTEIKHKHWLGYFFGDIESINYVVKHGDIDVMELKHNWLKLLPYVRITKTSI